MKIFRNTLIILITIASLFSVSCADSSITDNNTDQCSVYPGVYADFETMHTAGEFQVTVESINLDYKDGRITLTVTNPTDKIASCDEEFDIETLHGDHWESCKVSDPIYSENEKGIPENGVAEVTYKLGNAFSIDQTGKYRFRTNIFRDATGTRDKNELIIEFSINREKIYPVLSAYEISEGSAIISVEWVNDSDSTIYLTGFFELESLISGEWMDCQRTEYETPTSVFSINPGEKSIRTYVVEESFNLETFGDHRMYLEYAVNVGNETEIRHALIEFFIPYELHSAE